MKPLMFVRPIVDEERTALESGLRSKDAFTLRRCQMILASADGEPVAKIASQLRCTRQTVRNALHDFERRGLACLVHGSNIPLTVEPVLTAEKREQLQVIMHQSPRNFGKNQSQWTLQLLAEVCYEQGLSDWRLSAPTLLDAVVRLGSTLVRGGALPLRHRHSQRYACPPGCRSEWHTDSDTAFGQSAY